MLGVFGRTGTITSGWAIVVNEFEAQMLQLGIELSSLISVLQDSLLGILVRIKVKPRV